MIKIVLAVLFIAFSTSAHSQARRVQGAGVVVKCQADFSPLGPNAVAVQITKDDRGRMQSQINGTVSNQDVTAVEYQIRENLNMKTDPYSREAQSLNLAETSLVHLQGLMDDKDLRGFVKIPFDVRQVRKMTVYDLQGRQDKYGGTVLMEAYDQQGKLLGRVLRSVFAGGCY